jgi:hypothetical protein
MRIRDEYCLAEHATQRGNTASGRRHSVAFTWEDKTREHHGLAVCIRLFNKRHTNMCVSWRRRIANTILLVDSTSRHTMVLSLGRVSSRLWEAPRLTVMMAGMRGGCLLSPSCSIL